MFISVAEDEYLARNGMKHWSEEEEEKEEEYEVTEEERNKYAKEFIKENGEEEEFYKWSGMHLDEALEEDAEEYLSAGCKEDELNEYIRGEYYGI